MLWTNGQCGLTVAYYILQVREIILGLFQQKHKSVKKKQIVESLKAEGVTLADKILTAALKVGGWAWFVGVV